MLVISGVRQLPLGKYVSAIHSDVGRFQCFLHCRLHVGVVKTGHVILTSQHNSYCQCYTIYYLIYCALGVSVALLVARRTNNQPTIGRLRVQGLLK